MRTENIKVKLRDGTMGAYIAYPDKTPAGKAHLVKERSRWELLVQAVGQVLGPAKE